MIITAAISKGGTGKTTMVRGLSSVAAQRGYKVTIIDCDTQQHTRRWQDMLDKNDARPENFEIISVTDEQALIATANQYNDDTSVVIIDTEGTTNSLFIAALYAADIIVIPLRFALDDVLSGVQLVDQYIPLVEQELGRSVPKMFVITQHTIIDEKAKALKELRQIVQENGTPIAKMPLMSRTAYKDLQSGHTLYSMEKPDVKAIAECESLFDDLVNELIASAERAA